MSYITTPYYLTPTEWERVEDYIAENDYIYESIRDSMWYDVCDWLARDYNRNNEAFKCDSIAFDDSGEAIDLYGFEINTEYYFRHDISKNYDNGYDIYVSVDKDTSNDRLSKSDYYPEFGDNVVFYVVISHDEEDKYGYTEVTDFEAQCTTKDVGRIKSEFTKRGLESAYNEVLESMQDAIDELNSELEDFESEVIGAVAGWFTMRGPEFREYINSYPQFNIAFDDDGNVLDIEF